MQRLHGFGQVKAHLVDEVFGAAGDKQPGLFRIFILLSSQFKQIVGGEQIRAFLKLFQHFPAYNPHHLPNGHHGGFHLAGLHHQADVTGRGKGGAAGVPLRVGQGAAQCPVAPHGNAHHIPVLPFGGDPEQGFYQLGQFLGDVGEVGRTFRHVDVKALLHLRDDEHHIVILGQQGAAGVQHPVGAVITQSMEQVYRPERTIVVSAFRGDDPHSGVHPQNFGIEVAGKVSHKFVSFLDGSADDLNFGNQGDHPYYQ